jgi:hypothetical protein
VHAATQPPPFHLQKLCPAAGHHGYVGRRAWEWVQEPHHTLRCSRQQPQVLGLQQGNMQGRFEPGLMTNRLPGGTDVVHAGTSAGPGAAAAEETQAHRHCCCCCLGRPWGSMLAGHAGECTCHAGAHPQQHAPLQQHRHKQGHQLIWWQCFQQGPQAALPGWRQRLAAAGQWRRDTDVGGTQLDHHLQWTVTESNDA